MQDAGAMRDTTSPAAGLRAHAPALLAGALLLALAVAAIVRDRGATPALDDAAAWQATDTSRPRTAGDAGAALSAAAAQPRRTPPRGSATTARAAGLREAFEAAPDLFAYSQSLAPAVRAGDAEATWLMSKVVDYCAGYSVDPAGFARDTALLGGMGLRSSTTIAASRGRIGERCRRFSDADGLTPSLAYTLRIDAARAGSLAAEAALMGMGEPLAADGDYARDLVVRVRQSLDAEAYGAIAPAMGTLDARLAAAAEPDIAPQFRELAWQLAACELGMDCGPDSALMTSYCASGGICSNDATQDFEEFVYDAAVPRQSADLVRNMVDMLVVGTGGVK